MPTRPTRLCPLPISSAFIFLFIFMSLPAGMLEAQVNPHKENPQSAVAGADYSGMYNFLRDGEFVQITVEGQGHVIGFVSRYADSEGTGGFVDQFLRSGKLNGNQIAFTTETVNGVSYEFRGTIERGEGKNRGDEDYYALRGTLVETTTDEVKKTSSRSLDVVLKSFPQDLDPQAEKK